MDRTRSEAFLGDAQARDNVTEAELALDKDGNFLGLRVKIDRQHRRLSADRHARPSPAISARWPASTHAGHPCRRDRRVHPHQSGAALSRQRPARGRLCDRAHGRSRGRRDRHRSGGAAAAQLHPARRHAVTRPALTFTYDSGEFEKSMDMALKLADVDGLRAAPRGGAASAASCAASASPTPSSAPPRRASKAPRSASTGPARSRCSPAASRRARATRPSSSRSSATGSASIRTTCTTCRATPIRCSSAKAPAARAPPPSAARRCHVAAEKIIDKAKQIAAHLLKVDARRREIRGRACSPARRPTAP